MLDVGSVIYTPNTLTLDSNVTQGTDPAIILKVNGITKLDGVLSPMRVNIHDRNTSIRLTGLISKADGTFSYTVDRKYLNQPDLIVTVVDDTLTRNAQVIDFVTPTQEV